MSVERRASRQEPCRAGTPRPRKARGRKEISLRKITLVQLRLSPLDRQAKRLWGSLSGCTEISVPPMQAKSRLYRSREQHHLARPARDRIQQHTRVRMLRLL